MKLDLRFVLPFLILMACNALLGQGTGTDAQKEQVFIENARQLIYDGKRSGEGYFSQDGMKMTFQAERDDKNPFYQIYSLDFATGDVSLVSTGTGKTTCSWYNWANDNEVLFASTHLDPDAQKKQQEELDIRASGKVRKYSWDYDPTMDMFVRNTKTGKLTQVTKEKGYDAEGAFSPDGKLIVFSSTRSGYEGKLSPEEEKMLGYDPSYFGEIYVMNADGSNVKRLTNQPGYDGGPFFSPDGKKIVWRRFNEKGTQADVYTMNIDGTDVHQVTDFGAMSWAPYYHASMEYIIFASNKLGFENFELYIVDAAGTKEPVRVTYTDGFDGLAVFTPDGNKLAWTSNRTSNKQSHIFLGNWNHQAAQAALKAAPLRGSSGGAFTPAIKAAELKEKVSYLASDELGGRMTGSEGIQKAADYIIDGFKQLGLQTVPGLTGYKQAFEFIKGATVNTAGTSLSTIPDKGKGTTFELYKNYIPASFSQNGHTTGKVVYAGYGVRTPEKSEVQYNSYTGIDVKDKIVLVLEGEPDGLEDEDTKQLLRYSTARYKTMVARDLGARAIIFVDKYDKEFKGLGRETVPGDMGLPAIWVNPAVANELLAGDKTTVDEEKAKLEKYNPHNTYGFDLKNQVDLSVQLEKEKGTDYNVLAMLPATIATDEYVVIGAHYDHLGLGEVGSRADEGEHNHVHNGADDNASGTATVMEIAEYMTQQKTTKPELFERNIIFALWSGEEMGLVGSNHYIANAPVPNKQVAAYLNFDMVGRLRDNKLILQGLGSSDVWAKMVEKRNVLAGFNLVLQQDPYVPTDGMAFYQGKVPILCFFTGITDEYHRPEDDINTLDYTGMERIGGFAANILTDLLKKDQAVPYTEVSISPTASTGRGFSVYLGTIPDYAAEVEGVKLSGVKADGPAAKAGLLADDIIIKLGDKTIGNIYDYTYALGDLEPNVTYEVVVMRGGKQKKLKVTPMAK